MRELTTNEAKEVAGGLLLHAVAACIGATIGGISASRRPGATAGSIAFGAAFGAASGALGNMAVASFARGAIMRGSVEGIGAIGSGVASGEM